MIRRWAPLLVALLIALPLRTLQAEDGAAKHSSGNAVELHPDRLPKVLWVRELVWLHNIGISRIAAVSAQPEFAKLAAAASLEIEPVPANAVRVSALSPNAEVDSRRAVLARKTVLWTDVESESAPVYHAGAVSLGGDESPSLLALRREARLWNYWSQVLSQKAFSNPGPMAPKRAHIGPMPQKMPATVAVASIETGPASVLNVINAGKDEWRGALRAYLPTYKRSIEVPDVTVPPRDALLLPIDVSLADPQFCRMCSGMANGERLLYATAELTNIEYENGILSFEFYAPNGGSAVLQLEREPNGPMIAGGRPVAFDWDSETKRARLPIPAGKTRDKRMRIAITMNGPDETSSFENVRTLVIGQKNEILTDYTTEALAKRSRLVVPEGWKATPEPKSAKEIGYSVEMPANTLHGDHADLRIEADGVGMSHVSVQLLKPLSVHIAEASSIHFGAAAELMSDPPLIAVEAPTGRNIAVQLRNNAPEIRTFEVEISGEGIEFSPAKTEISIGASMEREISFRVFANGSEAGLHHAEVRVTGPAELKKPLLFAVIPRGRTVSYSADLLGTGSDQFIWENSRIRAVFEKPDGGRWLEFYWKESGKSLIPPDGIALAKPVKVDLKGDSLSIDGASGLPRGGKIDNVEWKAEVEGSVTRYLVTESSSVPIAR